MDKLGKVPGRGALMFSLWKRPVTLLLHGLTAQAKIITPDKFRDRGNYGKIKNIPKQEGHEHH